MRLLHTADFHAGRSFRGYSRLDELQQVLAEIAELAVQQNVDAVLVAGDIFDSANPSAKAEQVIFNFFLQLKQHQIPCIAIAGNHDSSDRMAALSELLGWVDVQLVAKLNPTDPLSAVRSITTKSGEHLQVAALPYISERRLLNSDRLWNSEHNHQKLHYRDALGRLISLLSQGFQPNAVHILMMHNTLDGAVQGGSERSFEFNFNIENSYSLHKDALPSSAHYVALGHIHKPQKMPDCKVPTVYAGSPLQLDFGEGGQEKGVYIIDVSAKTPAQVQFVALKSTLPLETLTFHLRSNEDRGQMLLKLIGYQQHNGLLKIRVILHSDSLQVGVKDEIQQLLPSVGVFVELSRPLHAPVAAQNTTAAGQPATLLSPSQRFAHYIEQESGKPASPELLSSFEALYQESQSDS